MAKIMQLTFSDVAVYFSEEEWRNLGRRQQELYKEVMNDNYVNLRSLGLDISKPDLFHEIEQWEKPPFGDTKVHEAPNSLLQKGALSPRPDILQDIERLDKLSMRDTREYLLARGAFPCLSHLEMKPETQGRKEDGQGRKEDGQRRKDGQSRKEDGETLIRKTPIGPLQPKCILCNGIYNCYCNTSKRNGKKSFRCIDCGKGYTIESRLLLHQKSHLREGPYKCSLCGKHFRKSGFLTKHQRTHQINEYQCGKCQVTFYNRKEFQEHKQTHKTQRQCKCSKCDEIFPSLQELSAHRKVHKKGQECSICSKIFSNRVDFLNHQQEHKYDTVYKCKKCAKVYKRPTCLLKHLETHSVQRQSSNTLLDWETKVSLCADVKCPSVQAKCVQKPPEDAKVMGGLTPSRNAGEPPNCNPPNTLLKTSTPTDAVLRNLRPPEPHINNTEPKKVFWCKKCRICFRHRKSLTRHRKAHLTIFKCHECGQIFDKLLTLFIHRFQHETNRPYHCKYCKKGFSLQSLLRLHHYTHEACMPSPGGPPSSRDQRQTPDTDASTAPERYSCLYCKKEFLTLSGLLLHQKSHLWKITDSPVIRYQQIPDLRTSPVSFDTFLWKRPLQELVACKDYVKRVCYRPSELGHTM
ncbi:zinc finger protein 626-like isoform X2 [Pseudophryne corroboree]|uniref:zinc finger protein 626-like isoform X2 n=1 Tax=Pseudophryne corroboree TaxID=495146 RepID=UPI0030817799